MSGVLILKQRHDGWIWLKRPRSDIADHRQCWVKNCSAALPRDDVSPNKRGGGGSVPVVQHRTEDEEGDVVLQRHPSGEGGALARGLELVVPWATEAVATHSPTLGITSLTKQLN